MWVRRGRAANCLHSASDHKTRHGYEALITINNIHIIIFESNRHYTVEAPGLAVPVETPGI